MLFKYLDKNNLHHAYLIEGKREEIVPEIFEFVRSLGIETNANSDFVHISIDSFKIEDARNLKSYSTEKGFASSKKIFIISVNSFLLEAQHSLLKMFEEPIENTHFFLVVPDTNSLLKTLVSRFYLISTNSQNDSKEAEQFIKMSPSARINFLKEFLKEEEEEENAVQLDSIRAKSLRFLNALEAALHQKLVSKRHFDIGFFEHIFKVREYLRMPGSSAKTLMESVAIAVPNL